MGVPWVAVGDTAVIGTIKGNGPGKTLALRADMDALPVKELNTGLPYCSQTSGVMHACGHDAHTASLLGAAKILQSLKDSFPGTVKLFFEPGEEIGGYMYKFMEAGHFKGLDGCFGIHVWSDLPVGKISVYPGPRMAGTFPFVLEVKGKSAHGAQPHQGIDPVVTMASVIMNLQTIVSREVSPLDATVISIGKLTSGDRFNIVPETAVIEGSIRTFDPAFVKVHQDVIMRIAFNTAKAFRAQAKFLPHNYGSSPPVINPPEIAAFAQKTVVSLFGQEAVGTLPAILAGEDFAVFQEHVPGLFAFVGGGNPDKGCNFAHHHGNFNIDEDSLRYSVGLYSQYAIDYLNA
jgi:amidohydrolase